MAEISTLILRLIWASQVLIKEAIVSNERFISMIHNFDSQAGMSAAVYFFVTYSILILSAYLLTYHKKSLISLIVAEVLNVSLIVTTLLVPSRAFRFFLGIQNFSYTMIIHAKVFEVSYDYYKLSRSKKPQQLKRSALIAINSKVQSPSEQWEEFTNFVKLIIGLGIPKHIKSKYPFPIWPSSYDIVFFFVISVVGDICSYILREYIPYHVLPENRVWGMSIIGSIWQCTALEFGYYHINLVCQLGGLLLPVSLAHKNPLLSTSIAEFWGVRWNPIISKQLQDCYYKPLRILGAPRVIGMLGTFLGSALIHAVPALISSDGDRHDCNSMFHFFTYQGISIIVEMIFIFLYRYILQRNFPRLHSLSLLYKKQLCLATVRKHPTHHRKLESSHGDEKKFQSEQFFVRDHTLELHSQRLDSLKNYHFTELLAVSLIVYFNYSHFEAGYDLRLTSVAVILSCVAFYNIVKCYHANIAIIEPGIAASVFSHHKNSHAADKKNLKLLKIPLYVKVFVNGGIVVGWIWTASCLMTQLPFFILPMMKVINEFYSESFAIGPIIRTVYKFMYFYG